MPDSQVLSYPSHSPVQLSRFRGIIYSGVNVFELPSLKETIGYEFSVSGESLPIRYNPFLTTGPFISVFLCCNDHDTISCSACHYHISRQLITLHLFPSFCEGLLCLFPWYLASSSRDEWHSLLLWRCASVRSFYLLPDPFIRLSVMASFFQNIPRTYIWPVFPT